METKDNNYRQFKWGGQYQSLELLICVLRARIHCSLGTVESWQVWGQGDPQQFLIGKNSSQILKPLGIWVWGGGGFCFGLFGFVVVLVCTLGWVLFGFSLSLHYQASQDPWAATLPSTEIGKLCCTGSTIGKDFLHPGLETHTLHSCWIAHRHNFYRS